MPFHPLTIGTDVFNQTGDGVYTHSSVVVGGPTNEFKISAGRANAKTGLTQASVTRKVELEFTEGGLLVRRPMVVGVQLTLPKGATVTQLDAILTSVDTFLTPAILTRVLLGEK